MTSPADRRRAPRYELLAQASVGSGDEASLLPVKNISASGAFLEGDPAQHPELAAGAVVELVLSASAAGMADEDVFNIRCKSRVARVEPARPGHAGGFGVTLEAASVEDAARLKTLLSRLSHVPPPRPGTSLT
jgi:hypothetical protein